MKLGTTTEILGPYTVTSDGSVVWINGPKRCYARFGYLEQEVIKGTRKWIPHPHGPTVDHWSEFVAAVREDLKINLSNEHMPLILKMQVN